MRILHTEASHGWGGQEIRIMQEALKMRERGHYVCFATHPEAKLAERASKEGFEVCLVPFKMSRFAACLKLLIPFIKRSKIDIINTHSSIDAWVGGAAARLTGRKVLRTRHLSAPIKKGLNSIILYNWLADGVATTCKEVEAIIIRQAHLPPKRCRSIPTGVDPSKIDEDEQKAADFRKAHGIAPEECLVGTLCVLRSWKGVADLLQAAHLLRDHPSLKWMVIGHGPMAEQWKQEALKMNLQDRVIFTGHIDTPYTALKALDIFALLSTANEGVSQSSLQAAYLAKPLITTPTGGLKEVALEGKTGFQVPIRSPHEVAEAVKKLANDPDARSRYGKQARQLVLDSFTLQKTIDEMEQFYREILGWIKREA